MKNESIYIITCHMIHTDTWHVNTSSVNIIKACYVTQVIRILVTSWELIKLMILQN